VIDRSCLTPDEADDFDFRARFAEARRARNVKLGRCINDSVAGTHGPVVSDGVRCLHCKFVHRYGAERAPRQPGYVEIGG
jgi:hypothetical protein